MTHTLPHLSWIDIPVETVAAAVELDKVLDVPSKPLTVDMVSWAVQTENPDDADALHIFENGSWEMVFSQFSIVGGRLIFGCEKSNTVGRRHFDPPLLLSPDSFYAIRLKVPGSTAISTSRAKVRFCLHGWTDRE